MSSFIKSYDLALKTLLYQKFGTILGLDVFGNVEENINQGIIQCPREIALREVAEKRGATFLEFINFWRTGAGFDWKRQRTSLARRGMFLTSNIEGNSGTLIKAVPVNLDYDVCFWSKNLDKIYQCDEVYAFWQQNNPKISLLFNDEYEITPDLHFGEIVDISTVSEKFSKGIIIAHHVPIRIDGWCLEGFSLETIHKIRVTFYDQDEITNYSEIIVDDSDQDVETANNLRIFRENLYEIFDVNLVTNEIILAGDFTVDFIVGNLINIDNSTGNDGVYKIVEIDIEEEKTKLKLDKSLISEIVDGVVCKLEN
jgi:hypothetical protein